MPKTSTPRQIFATREEWLMDGLSLLVPIFGDAGHKVPAKIRVSCGFPSKNPLGRKRRRIGECWADKASAGKYFEIFISPVLNKPVEVLDTLAHEIVHAVAGLDAGHRAPFKRVALSVGLNKGKMTEAGAGPELLERINDIAKTLGAYPHDELSKMTTIKKPKDKCRLLKAECPKCGYVIRVTKKWVTEAGYPTCPCGETFESDAPELEEEEGGDNE